MNNKEVFAFSKENYTLVLIGLVVVLLGFFLMSGGGSDDPNVFKGDYSLTTESFQKLTNQFGADPELVNKLKPLENKVFSSEEELSEALKNILGDKSYSDNYFAIRSATHIDADIFSPLKITVAPIVVLLGYILILFGIMYRKKGNQILDSELSQVA